MGEWGAGGGGPGVGGGGLLVGSPVEGLVGRARQGGVGGSEELRTGVTGAGMGCLIGRFWRGGGSEEPCNGVIFGGGSVL